MVRKKKYNVRNGYPINKKDAQPVGELLEHLMSKNNGELTPDIVVKEAKKKSSILHKYFEWDNDYAAERYRLYQARNIIGSIVEVTVIDDSNKEVRSFYNVSKKKGDNVYVTLETAVAEPDYIEQLISEAQRDMATLQKTLQMFLTYHSKEYKKRKKKK